jgi:pilus assembly protein CpaC
VKIAPNAKKLVAQNLNAQFQKAGLRNVQANVVGSTVFLEGSVESQQDLQKAELITKAFGEKVENLLVVGIKRMILSEVQFVEIRRNSRDRYGIKYPTDINGSLTVVTNFSRDIFPRLPGGHRQGGHRLRRRGLLGGLPSATATAGCSLAKLVCASGEGGVHRRRRVPIPLITTTSYHQYKPYSVIMRIRHRGPQR